MSTLTEIRGILKRAKPGLSDLIPDGAQVTADEIVTGAMREIAASAGNKDPKRQLDTCTAQSIVLACSAAASLGLVPGVNQDGWLIGYDNNIGSQQHPNWIRECQWMTGVKGIIRLIHMNPNISRIVCDVVYKKDDFEWVAGDRPSCRHVHARGKDRGAVECAYLIVFQKDGTNQGEKMDIDDLDKARSVSKMAKQGAWELWTNQMYRKCVAHRAAKWLPLSPKIRAVLAEEILSDVIEREEIGAELAQADKVKATAGEGEGFEEILEELGADGAVVATKTQTKAKAKAKSPAAKAKTEPTTKADPAAAYDLAEKKAAAEKAGREPGED